MHKLLDDRQHATESLHIAPTKEAVADETASSNTDITSCVSQTTLSDFSKNLKELSPTENEEEIDDQIRQHGFSRDTTLSESTWYKLQESIKGLNDKHRKFEIEQENVTDTHQERDFHHRSRRTG